MSDNADTLRQYYDKLFKDGFLMIVSISIWGMGAKLKKDDLGIEENLPAIFQLGKKMLIKPEHLNVFKRQESKTRRFLYANSLEFPIHDAHFVSKKKMLDVWTTLEKYQKEFNRLVEQFLTNYDFYRKEILDEYPDIADKLAPLYPSQEDLKNRFGFTITSFELSVPRSMDKTDFLAVKAQNDAEMAVREKLEKQMESQYATATKKLEQFVENTALVLRGQIVSVCNTIVNKIKKKEILSLSNIADLKEEIANFRSLNFLDDQTVSKEIDRLQSVVEGNHNFKTDEEAIGHLNRALTGVLSKAAEVTDISTVSENYFRKINVS